MEKKDRGYKPTGLARWTQFFLDRYRVTILLIIAIVIAGVLGVQNVPKQDFPDIPANFVLTKAIYPGASASDIEQEIIIPAENKLSEIEGIKKVRSTIGNNFGSIFIELDDFREVEKKATEINDAVKELSIPSDAEINAELLNVTGPTVAYAMVSDEKSVNELLELTPPVVTYLEGSSDEIKEVQVVPADELRVEVVLKADELQKNQLTKEIVVESLKGATTLLPGGFVKTDSGTEKPITLNSATTSLDDVKNLRIGSVKLGDIAEINRAPKDKDTYAIAGYVNENGDPESHEAVYLMAVKKGDGDVTRISDSLATAVSEAKDKGVIPNDVRLEKVFDTSPYVRNMISDLAENGGFGLILILIVLLFFINLRAGVVVALIIPLAFLTTWAVLPLLGFSLNILTLFAMILALGILVDNAIVIVEGIMANLEIGMKRRDATLKAVKDFGPAITAATVTTVIVLIPYAFIGGIVGEFFKYIPFTLVIMLFASYFLAITITPLFGKWILRETTLVEKREKKLKTWQKALVIPLVVYYAQLSIDCVVAAYSNMMKAILTKARWMIVVVILTVAGIALSFGYFLPQLQFVQFPENDGEQLAVSANFPAGTSQEDKNELYRKIADKILEIPHFENFFFYQSQFMVVVTEPTERDYGITVADIVADLDERLVDIRNEYSDTIINTTEQSYGPPGAEYNIEVELKSADSEALANATGDLEKFVNDKGGIDKIANGPRDLLVPVVEISFDKDKLSDVGISPMMTSMIVNSVFGSTDAGKVIIRDDGVLDEISVFYEDEAKQSVDDVKDILIPSESGLPVELGSIAEVKEVDRLDSITRLDGKKAASLKVKLDDPDRAGEIEQSIKAYFTEDKLNEFGLVENDVVYGGEFASITESSSNLQIVFVIAIILVYLVLVYQFNSFGQPFLILLTVPLALIGVFPGLSIMGLTLDMVSGLGIIALVGIVVNDAIVFLDHLNRLRRENPDMPLSQALVVTGQSRFKPIFTTSITTIGVILPLTIIDPFWTGLGTAVVSGLIVSTVGTLIILPVASQIFARRKAKKNGTPWLKEVGGCGDEK